MKPKINFQQSNEIMVFYQLRFSVLIAFLTGVSFSISTFAQSQQVTRAEKLFALQVEPTLRKKCFSCHGEQPDALEGSFDIRSRQTLLRGGDSVGPDLLVPGDSRQGKFMAIISRLIDGLEMPPKESEKLSQKEIEAIRIWIDGGAPWANPARLREIYDQLAEGTTWKSSGGLTRQWSDRKYKRSDLWAYQPLWNPAEASVKKPGLHSVDFFIDSQLADAGIQPAPLASRRQLVRRATFDLLGLPPTPQQISQFLNDRRPDEIAYSDLIDRLLDSPHYGEQWAKHWLDVVRYADSAGFANDWKRPNAWRYRDYVIRAFNQDKPYDQFVCEQLAGDELAAMLPQPDPIQNPRSAELHIATGFLRMGPWEHTGMSVARVTRQQFLDDITDSVGQVFLAHALQCCKCHDHKFDPIPTRDYYSIQAVFATTQFAEIETAWLPSENRKGMKEDQQYLELKLNANTRLSNEIRHRNQKYIEQWFASQGLPFKTVAEAKKAKVPAKKLPPAKYGWQANDFGQERVVRKWSRRLSWEMDAYRPFAYTVYNGKTLVKNSNLGRISKPDNPLGPGDWETTAILTEGDISTPGERVSPGVLSAIHVSKKIPDSHGRRRLAFAEWLTSGKNPLVPRVIVNRVWQYHFGRGIAGNANNFGATGKHPTHPHLLDWLANDFMRNGWSIKKLHKKIMTSNAYRRSIFHENQKQLNQLDPDHHLYAFFLPKQLSAEEIRDSMLAVSGELNREMGGIPVRPDRNMESALQPRLIMGTFAPAYVPNPEPAQRNRRSIYAVKLRGHRDPFMELFNQPGPDKSCEMRDKSMVTPQALTLLNGAETGDRALALAKRVLDNTDSGRDALEQIYLRAYGRRPLEKELEAALRAWSELTEIEKNITYNPLKPPVFVTRTANEENTGELFTFVEELFEHRDYQPDLQPHEVDARTRGLANICLAILNSNEFLFID